MDKETKELLCEKYAEAVRAFFLAEERSLQEAEQLGRRRALSDIAGTDEDLNEEFSRIYDEIKAEYIEEVCTI